MDTIHEYGLGGVERWRLRGGGLDNPAVEIHLWTFCVQRSDILLRYNGVIFPVKPAVNALFGVELTGFKMTAIKLIMGIIIIIEMREKNGTRTHTHTHTHIHTHAWPSQCTNRKMLQCCAIKQYTPTEKLQQIGRI